MSRILEKTVESVESFLSPFSTFFGFQSIIQRCISSKTKKEEEALIIGCLQQVKTKLGEPSPSHRSTINCLSFVVFADLLGYKAPFAHIHAVKLAGSSSIVLKKLGYLFSSYLLEPSHELSLLMVNTILRDLSFQTSVGVSYDDSHDPFAVAAALAASCYLIPLDSISSVLPLVMDKLNHPSPFVRAKAVSALQHLASQVTGSRFFHTPEQLSSILNGKPTTLMSKLLTDPHPSVVVIGLEFVHFLASQLQHMELCGNADDSGSTVKVKDVGNEFPNVDCENSPPCEVSIFQDLAPALVHIQRQILQGNIPEDYIFHTVPAPWMQISILKILRLLKNEDIIANEVHKLVIETFRAASRRVLIGWAIIIEVIHTAIETNLPESSYNEIAEVLVKLVIDSGPGKDLIPKWLNSNLLHTSLSLLQFLERRNIVAVNYVMTSNDLQDGLFGSINHSDPSIRRLAVGLITSHESLSSNMKGMSWTSEKICLLLLEECLPKKLLMQGLNHPVEQWKKECLERIVHITSAASEQMEGTSWQLAVLLRALPLAPDRQTAILIRERIQRFLLPPIKDLKDLSTDLDSDNVPRVKVLKLLGKHCHSRCASSFLLELYIWVLSHFHYLLPDTTPITVLEQLINLGQKVVFNNRKGNISSIADVLIAIAQGVTFIILRSLNFGNDRDSEWNEIVKSVERFANSVADLDGIPHLIDAYSELLRLLPHAQSIASVMKESSVVEDSAMDFTLSFLDSYICTRLEKNALGSSAHPLPPDCYNSELAISVRRQLSLCLPLHCHPWKVARVPNDIKDDLDLSASMSLTHLPSSCTASSHGTSIPDEFLSLSLESQPKDILKKDGEIEPQSAQASTRIWTSTGRSINFDESSTSNMPFSRETFNLDQRTNLQESRPQCDLMSLLLHTGNSGVVLNQKQDQSVSSDPLDILLNDGLHSGDVSM